MEAQKIRSMREILHDDFHIHGRDMGRFVRYMEHNRAIPVLEDAGGLWVQTKDVNGDILYEYLMLDESYEVIVEKSSREFPRPFSAQVRDVIYDMEERASRTFL